MSRCASLARKGAPFVIALLVGGFSYSLQTPRSCLSGASMWGCSNFGYGDDNSVAAWGYTIAAGTDHETNQLCDDVWSNALSWMSSFMTAVYDSAKVNGEDKDAISTYTSQDWESGWIGAWIRDGGRTTLSRGNQLATGALHEAMHRACDDADQYDGMGIGFECTEDPEQLEDDVDTWLGWCYGGEPN